MVITCSAPGCAAKKDGSNGKLSINFHRFPLRKPDILAKWIKAMKCPNFKPTVTSYLCSAHFANSDYDIKSANGIKHLKPNAVPSYFEKRRPGRKKKIVVDDTYAQDVSMKSLESNKEIESEDVEKVYAHVETDSKMESNLAEIIGNREKGTLQVLIVDEDGKITNSEYVFKKEVLSDDDFAGEPELVSGDNITNYENCNKLSKNDKSNESYVDSSEVVSFGSVYTDLSQNDALKKLENNLSSARKKIKFLQMQSKKLNKQNKELKFLLKLLVLKRGRGEKNLKQLLQDYKKYDFDCENVKIKEEFFIDN